jgi:hypothetical protein
MPTGSIPFGVKVWGQDESEPSFVLGIGSMETINPLLLLAIIGGAIGTLYLILKRK